MFEAVIFDMDGVIIDSEPVYLEWLRCFLERRGYHIPYQSLHRSIGLSAAASKGFIEELCGGKTEDLWKEYVRESEEYLLDYDAILFPGIKHLISELHNKRVKLGLASSSDMKDIKEMLTETELEQYFDIVLSGEMFKESKPNPAIYGQAAKLLKTTADKCIVIEDSDYGITAGKRVGAYVIARKDQRFDFDQSGADMILTNAEDIGKQIMKLLKL
mgnify:CR=1 FL=1